MPRLHFKGKVFVENHHFSVPFHELLPVRAKGLSAKASLHDNLIVHGDNLAALKALLPTHRGKVKCVYIDPPYNTGNEGWAYNDNVNSPMMQDWLGQVADREDLTRHDKWCCMMTPRLKLLRELLSDDGAIFVSIDDNEAHHLRCLLDEVFGEEHFVASIVWHHRKSKQNDIGVSLSHNHIFWYAKDLDRFDSWTLPVDESHFSNPDDDPRGPWVMDPMDAPNVRANMTYAIENPATGKIYYPPSGRHWRFSKEKYEQALQDGRIVFGRTGQAKPYYKRFLEEAREKGRSVATIWQDVGTATSGTKELNEIFGRKSVFATPKPSDLLRKIIRLSTDENSIVLDSFAGSGATAHAVLAQNREDGGNRRFVLIECEDYADTLTAERVRRVINGYPFTGTRRTELIREKITWTTLRNGDKLTASVKAIEERHRDDYDRISKKVEKGELVVTGETAVSEHAEGLGGSFSYFKLGHPMRQESLLDQSKLPSWENLAAYVFFTATGQEFDPAETNRDTGLIGRTAAHDVFLLYEPDVETLKELALTRSVACDLPLPTGVRRRLVFAPAKYLGHESLHKHRIDFQQLPFEIYEAIGRLEQ